MAKKQSVIDIIESHNTPEDAKKIKDHLFRVLDKNELAFSQKNQRALLDMYLTGYSAALDFSKELIIKAKTKIGVQNE